MAKKRILITGGAGFIGSHLTDLLIEKGFAVTILDNLLPQVHADAAKDKEGWPIYLHQEAQKIKGDVSDPICFQSALEGADALIHLAASVGVGQSMSHIVSYTRNNTLAAASMLEVIAQKKHSLKKIIVASSMSIYGEGQYFSKKKNQFAAPPPRDDAQLRFKNWELYDNDGILTPTPTNEEKKLIPYSIYAINKRDQEEMFLVMGRMLSIPTVALRLFNTYGSRQALANPYTGVAAIFISRLIHDLPPFVFEDGSQMRDFVHVRDVAAAFALVLESDLTITGSFNVGSGKQTTIKDIAEVLGRILKKNISPMVLETYRIGDIRHCFADIEKIKKTFGFNPQIDLEAGMEQLVDWVLTCPKPILQHQATAKEFLNANLII